MEALRSAFSEGTLSKLLGLDVSKNPLGPSGVATLARGLSASERALPLQSLKLSNTAAKAEGVKGLSTSLKEGKAPSLQVLDLGGNDMRAEGVGGLAGAVAAGTLSSLRVLILKANRVAAELDYEFWDFSGLAALFSHQFPALEELDVSGNGLQGDDDADTAAPMIGEALEAGRLAVIRKLNLLDTKIREDDLTALCAALAAGRVPSLQELHLCRVDDSPAEALALALDSGHLSQLTELILEDDPECFSEGVGVVMRRIGSGKPLSLRTIKIKVAHEMTGQVHTHVDEILGGLAQGLRERKLTSLEDLDLDFGQRNFWIPPEAVRELGLALGAGGLSSLRRLALSWKEDEDAGVGALAESLGSGGLASLEELSLKELRRPKHPEERGSAEGCRALGEMLSTGKVPSLRNVVLKWWVDTGLQGLAEGFRVGSLSPDVLVDLCLRPIIFPDNERLTTAAVKEVADLIRDGKVPGLRKLAVDGSLDRWTSGKIEGDAACDLGAALTAMCLRCPPLAECITKGKFPKLRNLRFSSDHFPISLGQEGMQAFALALCSPHAKSLRSLTLRSEERGNDRKALGAQTAQMSALSLALSFGQLTALQELTLKGRLFIESVSALCVGLGSGKLRSLRSLELPHLTLGDDEGTSALSQALSAEKLPALRCLILGSLNDNGLKRLAEAWHDTTPPPLEKLDLSGSQVRFTDLGVMALASLRRAGRLPLLWDLQLGVFNNITQKCRQAAGETRR
uniref:Uncharacterized protein n=1 Tax=Chromera velia CCMP2878 TaxID=1169474 RepID=A0A0G4HXR8_9ALVE|eukprot:Cvel_9331.t1-p1 / transcript=Cvel_9331.t1 / gene=Cvel_9331 / organism=Chromera_velia_CCMP2878 / gene_product=hypothetical protein / transcript_product=hypothetical protein / location=Cvel_scaffold535:42708-45103(+) / protein_length=740 / sequence_SO=supercontig / SO=protein_coding / is_pseudo=false